MTVDELGRDTPGAGPLPALRALLALYSTPGSSVAVSLQVGGFLVSGRAVPEATWLRAIAGRPTQVDVEWDDVSEAWAADEGLVRALHGDAVVAEMETDIGGRRVTAEEVRVVHLVDVTLDPLAGDEVAERAAWQVPLASIDGWTLDESADRPRVVPGPTWLAVQQQRPSRLR